MIALKLKPGLQFTSQGRRYLIVDPATSSTYRVGENEYLILRQFENNTNPEEVREKIRTSTEVKIPNDKLNYFIQKAIDLDLIEVVDDSSWGKIFSAGVFAFRVKLFDPNPILDRLIRVGRRTGKWWLILGCGLMLPALSVNIFYFRELWVLKSSSVPPYGLAVLLFVYISSLGHEMLHGLVAKWYGFEVSEIGLQMHYYLPSFYCKILMSRNAEKKKIGAILLAGSFFDTLIAGILLWIWFLAPAQQNLNQAVAFTVCLIWVKVLLINLNPILPFSDGYRIAGLFSNYFSHRARVWTKLG